MDSLCQIESLQDFSSVSQEIINNLYLISTRNSSHLDPHVFELAKNEVKTLISNCNFDIQKIATECDNKKWPSDKIKCFINLLEKNKTELLYVALNHYSSNYGETIVNFDWVLKFVLGTSELKTTKYPLLQLFLWSVNKNGYKNKLIFDIKKDMLSKMINVLEDIE